jgi:RNA polymerase sigma factor for flagellar operon FliA
VTSHAVEPVPRRTAARGRLITENLPLVGHLVRGTLQRSAQLDRAGLTVAAVRGLVRAADAYDAGRGATFAPLARQRINQAIADELSATAGAHRQGGPADVAERLAAVLGRNPTDEELAGALGVSPADLSAADPTEELVAGMLDSELRPEDVRQIEERARVVRAAVEDLPEEKRAVIERVYLEGRTVADVAAELGLAVSTVSSRHVEAVVLLRGALEARYAAVPAGATVTELRPGAHELEGAAVRRSRGSRFLAA